MNKLFDLLSVKIQNFSVKVISYILPTKIKRCLQDNKENLNDHLSSR